MNTKDLILSIASKSFFQKGYQETALRSIAKECGISVGNLTYHFRRKEDLLLGFYARSVEVINNAYDNHRDIHVNGIVDYITLRYAFLFWMKESPRMFRLYTETLQINVIRDEYNCINNNLLMKMAGDFLSDRDKRDLFMISSVACGSEREVMYIYSARETEMDFDYCITFAFKVLGQLLYLDEATLNSSIEQGFKNGRILYEYADGYIKDFIG